MKTRFVRLLGACLVTLQLLADIFRTVRDPATRGNSLGNAEEGSKVSGVAPLSDETRPPQAEDRPQPGATRSDHRKRQGPAEETMSYGEADL